MFSKWKSVLLAVILLLALQVTVEAQNMQNWTNNQAAQIQQDASTGLINANQAAKLENREAQIQTQEQQYASQNGGNLTAPQRAQVASELSRLNQHTGQDVQRNNPNLAGNLGYMTPAQWQQLRNNAWNQNAGQNVGYPAQQPANANAYLYRGYRRFQRMNGVAPNGQYSTVQYPNFQYPR